MLSLRSGGGKACGAFSGIEGSQVGRAQDADGATSAGGNEDGGRVLRHSSQPAIAPFSRFQAMPLTKAAW